MFAKRDMKLHTVHSLLIKINMAPAEVDIKKFQNLKNTIQIRIHIYERFVISPI